MKVVHSDVVHPTSQSRPGRTFTHGPAVRLPEEVLPLEAHYLRLLDQVVHPDVEVSVRLVPLPERW